MSRNNSTEKRLIAKTKITMKKIIFAFAFASVFWSCKTAGTSAAESIKKEISVSINLIDIKDDKVMVTVNAPSISVDEITYHIPKTVPGTYSEDNYGRYIDDLKAYDTNLHNLCIEEVAYLSSSHHTTVQTH